MRHSEPVSKSTGLRKVIRKVNKCFISFPILPFFCLSFATKTVGISFKMSLCPVTKNGIEVIHSLLGLGEQDMADVVVAIDFGGGSNIKKAFITSRRSQLGLSVIDLRDVRRAVEECGTLPTISIQNYWTGYEKKFKALQKFRFGIAEAISIYDVADKVRQCMKRQDDANIGEHRKIDLVGQWVREEDVAMKALRVSKKKDLDSVVANLDTAIMGAEMFHRPKGEPIALQDLSVELEIPIEEQDFHAAGNDANCTLRALLLLAVRHHEKNYCDGSQTTLLRLLRDIGRAQLPPRMTISEFDRLVALQPNEHVDDPEVPVDTSRFTVTMTRSDRRKRGSERCQARRLEDKVLHDEVLGAAVTKADGLRLRDLNIPRGSEQSKVEMEMEDTDDGEPDLDLGDFLPCRFELLLLS
jgi:hypothetical protein